MKSFARCAGPMVATTRALCMGQAGSFSAQSGASDAEISRTTPDPTVFGILPLAIRRQERRAEA